MSTVLYSWESSKVAITKQFHWIEKPLKRESDKEQCTCFTFQARGIGSWNASVNESHSMKRIFFVVANQTLETIAVKVVEWIIVFKKYILLTLLRMLVRCRYFSFSLISSRTIWRHINTAWLPSTISKWLSTKSNFGFLLRRIRFRIAGTLEVETSVSGKKWKSGSKKW